MAEVKTDFYKDAVSDSPLKVAGEVADYRNKLLQNVQSEQAVQANNIKLATERFKTINDAAAGILSDPELGKTDVTKKLWDTLGRLTKGDAMSAQHAVQFMQQFPADPQQQRQAIQGVHAQTLNAWQRGEAYLGTVQRTPVGGGVKFEQTPAYGGAPPRDIGYIPNTLQPGEKTINANPNDPNYGRETTMGVYGNPPIQPPAAAPAAPVRAQRAAPAPAPAGAMPPVEGAPSRAKVPSSAKVVGDEEATRSGLYETPTFNDRFSAARPVTALAPGESDALKGSAASYNDAMVNAGKYSSRVNPLRQAIPLLEKMKETQIGPTSERWNDIKSTAITLGAGKLAGIDPEKIRDYNELKKYFTQYASQAAATLGPKTNDGLATAVTSNPNVHMDKLSATELAKVALGIERMQQAAALEFNAKVQAGKAQPGTFNRFMLQWATEQDPRAFVYDIMDKKGQDRIDALKGAELKKFLSGVDLAKKWKLIGDVHSE